ncbi:integrin alpha-PS1 isoform X2 [Bacillus rossius redtenbacheri]|uniref:integrin alpha-PS1 isoform X2 n=1 Tax=Bacillus rossius redtenbacheri TaxID=93214 RepID=UPI002FDD2F44
MGSNGLYACFLLLLQMHANSVRAFNLEPRIPLIKKGSPGSYFGYSVAEHQTVDDITQNVDSSWLLVGAPLDQNLQPRTNRSGALWRCPITTLAGDCEQVVTDGKRTIDSSELMPPLEDEVKDGQWLGVTVRSQGAGGKVMVCAHRYVRKGNDYQWGQGMCYTLTQYLDYDESWEPCKGRPVNKAHEQYGYCQAGTSGVLLNDTAVIGTPGPYTWRGTVYVISVSDDYLSRDKTMYYGPLSDLDYPVDKYSYLGMSVTAGRFLGDALSYAAGAPRSNGTGQVVLFALRPPANPMAVALVLGGEQFASSFGYEVASADVDGDKLPDLIVGAPFFFSEDQGGAVYIYMNNPERCLDCHKPVRLTGKPESRFGFAIASLGDLNKDGFDDIAIGAPYEGEGVVYIYLGSSNGILTTPSQILRAADFPKQNRPQKTFGYSLSGGLDVDQNGYPDLLVGAYESDSVVLVRSRPIIGIVTTIEPDARHRKIDPGKQGCASDPSSEHTCFSFETCCVVEARVRSQRRGAQNLTVSYGIEAEVFPGSPKKYSRVWFGQEGGGGDAPHVVRKTLQLAPDPRRGHRLAHCETETVYISRNASDIQSPIDFRLTYALVQREPRQAAPGRPLPAIDDHPILNQQEASKTFRFAFQTDCGDNDVCESELRVQAGLLLPPGRRPGSWELLLGEQKEVRLNVTVQNLNESAYDAWLHVAFPPSLAYISHLAELKHTPCDRFNVTLVSCKLGNPFKKGNVANVILRFDPTGIKDIEPDLRFVVFANSTSEERRPQGPLAVQADVIRKAEVSIAGSVYPDHVFYGGEVRGESAMEYRSDVGSRVLHSFVVRNKGPWRVSSLTVAVEWPFQVANDKPRGKWLLYLDEMPTVEAVGGGECLLAEDQVNPLGLPQRPGLSEAPLEALTLPAEPPAPADASDRPRSRRDTEMVVRAEAYTGKDGRRHEVVKMDCLLGTAKCLKFNCTVFNLNKNREATIKIRARLWNSTLVEDYPRVDSVNISSRAKVHLPRHLGIQQDTANDETQAVTIAYPDRIDQQEPEAVPVWIIVVAAVAGLLLLVLLVLVLWKLGFFKRRRPDPTLSGNLEKHREDNGQF